MDRGSFKGGGLNLSEQGPIKGQGCIKGLYLGGKAACRWAGQYSGRQELQRVCPLEIFYFYLPFKTILLFLEPIS